MAIAIRGTTPATQIHTGDPTSVTLTGSRQPQTDDVLVIIHCNDFYLLSNMPTPTVGGSTTGVTAITNGTADVGTDQCHIKSWWFHCTSTADRTVAVDETGSADEEKGLIVYVLSGVDTTTPIDVAGNAIDTTPTSGLNICPSISPTSSDAYLICFTNSQTSGGFVHPSGMTETVDVDLGGAMIVGSAVLQLSSSGATGTKTFDCSPQNPNYAALSIAVKTGATGGATASPGVIAATTTVPLVTSAGQPMVTHVNTGTVVAATSGASNPITATPAYPGSGASGDLAVLTVVSRHDTGATPTVTAGGGETWTSRGSINGGGGTFGAGTGDARTTIFTAPMASASPTAPTVNLAGTNTGRTLQAVITILRGTGYDIAFASGAEATAGTGWSEATTSDPGITGGDLLLIAYGVRDDQHSGFTAMGITATSATIAAVDERADAVTGNGNDAGLAVGTTSVTAGTGSANPVVTATIGTSESGSFAVLRVRLASSDTTASPAVIARSFVTPQAGVGVGAAPAVIARAVAKPQVQVSVGAAPAVIARAVTKPQVQVSVGAVPAVVARSFTLPQATGAESTTTTPAVIARSFTVPQAGAGVGAAPAVTARAFTVPQLAASVGAAPVAITRSFTLPLASPGAATSVTPAVIDRSFTVPQSAVSVAAAPAVIARLLALPQGSVSVGAAPAVLAAVVVIPEWSVNPTVGPDTAPTVVTLPQATPSGGAGPATATPAVIARVFAVPQAGVGAGAAPLVISRAFALPQAVESVGAAPVVISRAFALPLATTAGATAVTPLVIARAFTVPQLAVSVGAAPAVTARAFTVPQLAASVGAAPAVIARAFTVPLATTAGATAVNPAVIARLFTVPQLAVSVGAAPLVIARVFTVPQATPVDSGIPATAAPAVIARSFVLPQLVVSVGVVPTVIARVFVLPQAIVVIPPLYSVGAGTVGEIILIASGVPVVATTAAGESGSQLVATGVTGISGG